MCCFARCYWGRKTAPERGTRFSGIFGHRPETKCRTAWRLFRATGRHNGAQSCSPLNRPHTSRPNRPKRTHFILAALRTRARRPRTLELGRLNVRRAAGRARPSLALRSRGPPGVLLQVLHAYAIFNICVFCPARSCFIRTLLVDPIFFDPGLANTLFCFTHL